MPGRNGCRVFIGRIPYSCREKDLERFFRNYGHLRDIIIKHGYGFVEFDDERDADDAVYELNGKDLLGERVTVEHAKGVPRRVTQREYQRRPNYPERKRFGPPVRTPYRVIVENLSTKVSWQDLKDFMRKVGEISYADAHRQHRNEGLVEFQSYSDLKRCMDKLDGKELMGRRIRLVSQYRSRSRSRSRSGSRYRSRSRSRGRRSRTRSRSRSDDRGKSRSGSRSRSRSKSRTPDREHRNSTKSDEPSKDENDQQPMETDAKGHEKESRSSDRKSRSRTRSSSRGSARRADNRSRSRSGSPDSRRRDNRSRSRSMSPGKVNGEADRSSRSPNGRSDDGSRSRSRTPTGDAARDRSESRGSSTSRRSEDEAQD